MRQMALEIYPLLYQLSFIFFKAQKFQYKQPIVLIHWNAAAAAVLMQNFVKRDWEVLKKVCFHNKLLFR